MSDEKRALRSAKIRFVVVVLFFLTLIAVGTILGSRS